MEHEDDLEGTAAKTLKPSHSALAVIGGGASGRKADKIGLGPADPIATSGDTGRMEDLKKIWPE